MAFNYGVIGFIKAPILDKLPKKALVEFKQEYHVYKEKCADVSMQHDEAYQIYAASFGDGVDRQMISALVKVGKIPGASTIQEATPAKVDQWHVADLDFAQKDLSEWVDFVLTDVKYTRIQGDPDGSALTFWLNVMKSLVDNVEEHVFSDEDKASRFIYKLTIKLGHADAVLRERMSMKREGWSRKEKSNFQLFEKELSAFAIDVHQNAVAFKRTKNYNSNKV